MIAVLGAGLQGVTVAMALARTGRSVTLIDRAGQSLTRASLRNEGKVHLGFVYANDPTCRTSTLMLDAALAFGPLIESWTGRAVPWADLAGAPFRYLILRESLVPHAQLFDAWQRLDTRYRERDRADRRYLGTQPDRLWWPAASGVDRYGDAVAQAVDTAELALDMPAFCRLMRDTIAAEPRVTCHFNRDVHAVARTSSGFRVEGTDGDGGRWAVDADVVVNCLWEGRLAIDRQMDLLPARPWVYRLKHRLLVTLPPQLHDLPSLTLMLGRFGDIVNYGGGRGYLSWYPACLRGWSGAVEVPADWDRACRGELSAVERDDIARSSLDAFESIVPGLGACRVESVAAGVIFSWGATDIDDPVSELHRRDDIGPQAHDGYITVNTGKITTAPLFASRVLELLR